MMIGAAAMLLSPLLVSADTYTFIVSGYPAANESYAAVSTGTALVTATRNERSAASSIEARFRTWLESVGIALRSDLFKGLMLMIR